MKLIHFQPIHCEEERILTVMTTGVAVRTAFPFFLFHRIKICTTQCTVMAKKLFYAKTLPAHGRNRLAMCVQQLLISIFSAKIVFNLQPQHTTNGEPTSFFSIVQIINYYKMCTVVVFGRKTVVFVESELVSEGANGRRRGRHSIQYHCGSESKRYSAFLYAPRQMSACKLYLCHTRICLSSYIYVPFFHPPPPLFLSLALTVRTVVILFAVKSSCMPLV